MPPPYPPLRHLNWNLLRTFLVIVEERSITKAAERLHVRQPAVTAALKKLEDVLGVRLIERDSHRFVLTGRGEALRDECQEVYRRIERIGERVSNKEDDLNGSVRMLIVTEAYLPPLDQAISLMHEHHPRVTISLDVANSQEIVRSVARGLVPFGFCNLQKPVAVLDCKFMKREQFGLYCGRRHPLFERSDVTLEQLRAESFVSFTCAEADGAFEPMVALREGARLGARMAGLSSHIGEIIRLVRAGIGIGLLPETAAAQGVQEGSLRRLPVLENELGADLYFIRNPESSFDRAEQAFLDMLLSAAAR